MTISDLLAVIVSVGSIQALLTLWLKTRLENSVRHEYDRRLEEFRYELRQREQAAMVAELLAVWTAKPINIMRLNQLTWEASLWLPEKVLKELSRTLSHAPGAKGMKEILVEVRKLLKGSSDCITAEELIHFNVPTS